MSYDSVARHRPMALDRTRNTAYWTALAEVVGPDSVVLDLGAGVGIHGLMAARLGARRVYLVEPEDVILVARDVARANGLGGVVECLQGRIQDVRLPERVHVIVSALTGNFLVAEDLIETLIVARESALVPEGTMIPAAATMEAVPVSAPEVHEREISAWANPQHGVDLGRARPFAANTIYYRQEELQRATPLAEATTLHAIDFTKDAYGPVRARVSVIATGSDLCHGWVGWFRMRLGPAWVSTSPWDPPLHWRSAFLPVDPPLRVEQGEAVAFSLDRPPFGEWTWSVEAGAGRRQHSTFFATPVKPSSLERARPDYRPSLGGDGQTIVEALSRFDGSTPLEVVARELSTRHPGRFASEAQALAFVQRLARRYS